MFRKRSIASLLIQSGQLLRSPTAIVRRDSPLFAEPGRDFKVVIGFRFGTESGQRQVLEGTDQVCSRVDGVRLDGPGSELPALLRTTAAETGGRTEHAPQANSQNQHG